VYIWAPQDEGSWAPGAASRWWLHHSLTALAHDLEQRGSRLILRTGRTEDELTQIIRRTKANAVFWNRRYEPALRERDKQLAAHLADLGVEVQTFNGDLLVEPAEVSTKQGKPYQVYTPFWRACGEHATPDEPLPCPEQIPAPPRWPSRVALRRLGLLPKVDWASGFRSVWSPGTAGAYAQLERFLESGIDGYDQDRNRPDLPGSSRLSPHLHFGEISPRTVWHMIQESQRGRRAGAAGAQTYRKEIFWREFAHHLLHWFPHTTDEPLRDTFRDFPWAEDAAALAAWQQGETGYPLVDAGMRELWTTGWMHNRVRMIVASFLVKDLLIHWRHGARWFWDTLVDADLANNTLGWQWTAGCGADAAPFFRIFNPVTQGERFDPHGRYVRQWVPELARLPDRWLHAPWTAPESTLASADVRLGDTYPQPIVDHSEARQRALDAYKAIKK
jgi:deoxyribodipyrimidine photo-lyase